MKRAAMLLILCASLGFAQQQVPSGARVARPEPARVQAPSYSDMYCAGFISKQIYPRSNFIAAGAESPAQSEFHQGDFVFLEGTPFAEGARFSVLRELKDPNRSRAFKGQATAIAEVGQPYSEMGRVRVTAIRGKVAVAQVEFSCGAMAAGDIVVPFQEKPPVTFRPNAPLDRFPAETGSVTGRIVMAKDFDFLLGTGHKVYLNVGADKGIKVGDYFHAIHTYDRTHMEEVDALSLKTPQYEETQNQPSSISKAGYAGLPKQAVAQLIVLSVTPTSATAMITYAAQNVSVGDTVELEGASAGPGQGSTN